jgi:hypothetical protein
MGYHPGAEDDGVYLAAVQSAVTPALYPHDVNFVKMQMHTSVFDTWMGHFIHATGISIAWSEFGWQFVSLFLMLWAGYSILYDLFDEKTAIWGGVGLLAAMFTLPVAGTALYIADQYLHPRNLATALIMLAISRMLTAPWKRWQAMPLLAVAFILHPLMGAMGASFCFVLALVSYEPLMAKLRGVSERVVEQVATPVAAFIPFGWVFQQPSKIQIAALGSRHAYQLYSWTWYEWLGAIAPLIIFWEVARHARKRGNKKLERLAMAIVIYGVFQQVIAMIICSPAAPLSMSTLEPMRYLQLVYIFLTLIGGAYMGRYLLKDHIWRWVVVLAVANGSMFVVQQQLFAETQQVELPGQTSPNPWMQAFDWIRENTPQDAYFAVDPNYMALPLEDNRSFRALTERSVLADINKDAAIVTKVPELGLAWSDQVEAQAGWSTFKLADFERLKRQFGVNWVLVPYPEQAGLTCRWHNDKLAVCQVP